jgi:hypothetical protein
MLALGECAELGDRRRVGTLALATGLGARRLPLLTKRLHLRPVPAADFANPLFLRVREVDPTEQGARSVRPHPLLARGGRPAPAP